MTDWWIGVILGFAKINVQKHDDFVNIDEI
jgi:hypothetical protein